MATVEKDVEVFMEELIESFVVMYLSANNLYLHLYAICGNSNRVPKCDVTKILILEYCNFGLTL